MNIPATSTSSHGSNTKAKPDVVVIAYELGDLRKASKALEAVVARVELPRDREKVASVEAAVLPGAGAFSTAMQNPRSHRIVPAILQRIAGRKTVAWRMSRKIRDDDGEVVRKKAGWVFDPIPLVSSGPPLNLKLVGAYPPY